MAAALRRLLHGAEVERVRPEPEPPPPPWGMEVRRCPLHGCRADRTPRGDNGRYQGIDHSYTNGVYGTQYSAPGTGPPPYPSLPQSNAYYPTGHPHAPYSTESPGMYQSQSPASNWNYPPPDCPAEGSMVRRQISGYAQPPAPGFPVSSYPYGDCNHGIPQQGPPPPPQPRLQDTTWRPPGTYGMQPPYGWSPASTQHGNRYVAESSAPWPTNGASAPHPPINSAKDSSYNQLEQGTNQHSYFPEASHLPPGTMNDHKLAQLDTKPSASSTKVQYSAQPQLYDNVQKKPVLNVDYGSGFKSNGQLPPEPSDVQPGVQKVMDVMEGVELLEEEVDEFVGKKTDKGYRLLEEMLTKKLLELDSIETGGQENVRQARKEAVHRIQAILEELERKGL
ncbi:BAG family molecular chaperone regulator 4 isoform X2 [Sphaerodactylus townsendi]|uniref:BAG family molecular chaperone regulator 4 isoform X2 n=1 Tax=Sphaerodactylus townsendi TaxID=933632 RepID=UPI002026E65A|nr:BAG family molecular chaperone regulator 4 isoform X2 [Sphaerodactylus townsendi]